MTPDVSRKGQSLVVLMRGGGEKEAEEVAVQVVSVFGHCNTTDKQPASLMDCLVSGACTGGLGE